MAPPPLVAEPEEVTPAWLDAVLTAAGIESGAAAGTLTYEPVGVGLMARSYRFRLDGSGGPASVVVKLPSTDQATRQLGAGAYRREVGFYRDIAASVDGSVPGCYHADVSPSGEQFVLVLEDITPAEPGDQVAGCSVTDAQRALTSLARIHAATWLDERIARLPWLAERAGFALDDLMAIALGAFEERFADRLAPTTWPILRAFAVRAGAWRASEGSQRAAVHGDYRLDNLLFPAGGHPAIAVDWQTVDYVSPGRDVAYFLGNSLSTADRRDAEAELVEGYLTELARQGIEDYTSDQCWEDIRHGSFQGPLTTVLGAFVTRPTGRSEQMFTVMADRSAAQIRDLDALDVLP